MASDVELHDVIMSVLKERFDDVVIESISVDPDFDKDGDPILVVKVIFDGTKKQLDARKTSTVIRHLRPKLAEINETAFPIISYISKSEYGNSSPAPA